MFKNYIHIIQYNPMLTKSKSVDSLTSLFIHTKTTSFSDFQQLSLGGCQKILTFGEYSNKKNHKSNYVFL